MYLQEEPVSTMFLELSILSVTLNTDFEYYLGEIIQLEITHRSQLKMRRVHQRHQAVWRFDEDWATHRMQLGQRCKQQCSEKEDCASMHDVRDLF